jgi:cytochrome b
MQIFEKIRAYHAGLVVLTVLSYVTGEAGEVHEVLGYGVAALILFRLGWAVVGPRQVGLSRFFPKLPDLSHSRLNDPAFSRILISIVALALIATIATGVLLEKTPAAQQNASISNSIAAQNARLTTAPSVTSKAYADDDDQAGERREKWLEEVHELTANFLVLAVAAHVLYLFLFRRDLALFMLFVRRPRQ